MKDWFLPQPSGSSPDSWCFKTAITWDLQIYVIVAEYYKRIADLFSSLEKDDEIFIISWGSYGLLDMGNGRKLQDLLLNAAVNQNVKIKILQSQNREGDYTDYLKGWLLGQIHNGNIEYITDSLCNEFHQKSIFVRKRNDYFLFIGGMDLQARPTNRIDVQAEIRNEGAKLGFKSIVERWNAVSPNKVDVNLPKYNHTNYSSANSSSKFYMVQFLRTYPSQNFEPNPLRTYASNGDFTYYHFLSRAVSNVAKNSIYIEDQFLEQMVSSQQPPSIRNVLNLPTYGRDYLPEKPPTLDAILLRNKARIQNFVIVSQDYLQSQLFPKLQGISNFPKCLKINVVDNPNLNSPNNLEVHSKTWILDDELVIIGSGNYWGPSFIESNLRPYITAEFGIAIQSMHQVENRFGFENIKFGRALRLRMWERIKQLHNPSYSFDRSKMNNFRDEFIEFTSDISLPTGNKIMPLRNI
jgi:phosphatidylserine/phosphatidylglycerophosphate/cardiolipin synthase-like enzyme